MAHLGDGTRAIVRIFIDVKTVSTSWTFRKSCGVGFHGHWQLLEACSEESLIWVILLSHQEVRNCSDSAFLHLCCYLPFLCLLTNFSTLLGLPFDFGFSWLLLIHKCFLIFLIIQSFSIFTICQFHVRFLGDSVCWSDKIPIWTEVLCQPPHKP